MCDLWRWGVGGKATVINAKYNSHDIFEEEIVAINNDMEYYNLMHSLGIVVVRGPKISAYNRIMEEISSTGVVIQKWFCGSKATVFMRKIFEVLYLFNEKTVLFENDVIVAFAAATKSAKIKQWIYGL